MRRQGLMVAEPKRRSRRISGRALDLTPVTLSTLDKAAGCRPNRLKKPSARPKTPGSGHF